ncbi:ATP-binding protein [Streptomyces sp. G7(2002)]|uniref:ATP-binding protein n=1 Tax=Streptomyces sp. G7(2002) TaxID=2971798 RepID=UPI00237E14A9|nr:ATP-binding protein [Streptomyces sp. G7(2002)]WDT59118.1 ATP-binding protein [Streptomyces sp. G7(2002)]
MTGADEGTRQGRRVATGGGGAPLPGPAAEAAVQQTIRVESGFGYGVVGADLHVFPDRGPVYLLGEHRSAAPAPDDTWLLHQPSRMLNARYRLVDFTGRERERAELAAWRDAPGPRLSATWLHGPGGHGKSRLADEFAAESAAAGWKVVTATHGPGAVLDPGRKSGADLRPDGARGMLLVVDYADRWPVSHLTWLFSNRLLTSSLPTRLLLLARSSTAWPAVRSALEDVMADTRDQELAPLGTPGGDPRARSAMFAAARDCFAARYGVPDPAVIAQPKDLERPEFGLVLAVHMAALVAVDAHVRGEQAPDDLAGLSAYLLNRERRHWTRLWENRLEGLDFSTAPSDMNRVVFTAALTGAVSPGDGSALLAGIGLERPLRLLTDHGTCYPAAEPGAVLEPLYPDRLAEDFLALSLDGHRVTGYPAAPWAAPTARTFSARAPDGAVPPSVTRGLTFLAAAAAPGRWPHIAGHLEQILRQDPSVAVAAGSAALTALAETTLPASVLASVETCFPEFGQPDLDAGIATFTARLVAERLPHTAAPAERGRLHQGLGFRLGRAGRAQEALAADEEAVRCFRKAAAAGTHPAGSPSPSPSSSLAAVSSTSPYISPTATLATALLHLTQHAFDADAPDRALHAAEEAAALFQDLAVADPAAHEPGLALALAQVGRGLAAAGYPDRAMAPTEQAVGIFWRLTATQPDRYETGLALALNNLGIFSWQLRRLSDAVAAQARAIEFARRGLAAGPPAGSLLARAFVLDESELAQCLGNLSFLLWASRRREEAVTALEEAVATARRLAAVAPAAQEPVLADLASRLATYLGRLQRWREALTLADEAAGITARLAAADPVRYESDHAKVLRQSAQARLGAGGSLAAARRDADMSVAIYRRLAAEDHAEYSRALEEAVETQELVRSAGSGGAIAPKTRWTSEEHWVNLLNQDEVWQDVQDRRHRLDEMPPSYCGNVLRFIRKQADQLIELLADGLDVTPEALGLTDRDDAVSWLDRQPLIVALARRARGESARPEICHCGYPVAPDWHHEHCYPGIVVD